MRKECNEPFFQRVRGRDFKDGNPHQVVVAPARKRDSPVDCLLSFHILTLNEPAFVGSHGIPKVTKSHELFAACDQKPQGGEELVRRVLHRRSGEHPPIHGIKIATCLGDAAVPVFYDVCLVKNHTPILLSEKVASVLVKACLPVFGSLGSLVSYFFHFGIGGELPADLRIAGNANLVN